MSPVGGSTLMTCAPNSANSLPQKGPDTPCASSRTWTPASGKSTVRMPSASRAANDEFVEASGTAEKVFPSMNLASDCFRPREIQLAHRVAHHLLCDRRWRLSAGFLSDTTLGEYELRDEVS